MSGMILGRNTQQWMGLITSILGFVGMVIGLLFPTVVGPATIIINGVIGVFGVLISFIANTSTTPISDARIPAGNEISVTDQHGAVVGTMVAMPDDTTPAVQPVKDGEDGVA